MQNHLHCQQRPNSQSSWLARFHVKEYRASNFMPLRPNSVLRKKSEEGARYIVTKPVEGPEGNPWWGVADTESETMENFAVATFFKDLPDAGKMAYDLCDKLNHA